MNPTERQWWEVACAATDIGLDVIVLDPEADEDESYWDEDPEHGEVFVRAHRGTGWSLTVTEPEVEID